MFLHKLLNSFNSSLSCEFSRLNLSFSSRISAVDVQFRSGGGGRGVAAAAVTAGDELDERTCSSPEVAGEIWIATAGGIATVTDCTFAVEDILRRWMSLSNAFSPLLKQSFANSHLSGTTFRNPCKIQLNII